MIKITGVSKSEHRSLYVLAKDQAFFSGFRMFLVDLGFDHERVDISSLGRPIDEFGEPDTSREEDISLYVDKRSFFENKEYTIDVVFGKDRIFVIIASYRDKQDQIVKSISTFCTFADKRLIA
jgi:hypothetical protein